jgi:hypothetical protein
VLSSVSSTKNYARKEFANGHKRQRVDNGRDSRGEAAAVGKAQVHDGRVGIELLPEAVCDHFEAGQQCAFISGRVPAIAGDRAVGLEVSSA